MWLDPAGRLLRLGILPPRYDKATPEERLKEVREDPAAREAVLKELATSE